MQKLILILISLNLFGCEVDFSTKIKTQKNNKIVISTDKAPAAVGPYSQGILIDKTLYLAGQIALDPSTGLMVGNGNIEEETRQVIKNLLAVIQAAGGQNSNVIRTTIYLTDLKDFSKVNAIYAETFGETSSPARACVEVSNLPKGGKIEIDCVAWLGNK